MNEFPDSKPNYQIPKLQPQTIDFFKDLEIELEVLNDIIKDFSRDYIYQLLKVDLRDFFNNYSNKIPKDQYSDEITLYTIKSLLNNFMSRYTPPRAIDKYTNNQGEQTLVKNAFDRIAETFSRIFAEILIEWSMKEKISVRIQNKTPRRNFQFLLIYIEENDQIELHIGDFPTGNNSTNRAKIISFLSIQLFAFINVFYKEDSLNSQFTISPLSEEA